MKERILKLLESTVEADIELAMSLMLKHIPEEIESIFGSLDRMNMRKVKLYIQYQEKVYRTSTNGWLLRTELDIEELVRIGFKEVTL